MKCATYNGYRENSHKQKREISFSKLPDEAMEQLAVYDRCPWEYSSIIACENLILIENDFLSNALNKLPQENREILLMY